MKALAFGARNAKETLRDPLNLAFGLGFPAVLIALLSAIQANIPADLFEINKLAPGVAVFGLSFVTLFTATTIARDRKSAFLQRLYSAPVTAAEFIAGYTLPMLPLCMAQTAVCFAFAAIFGFDINANTFAAVAAVIPSAVLYTALGLLCGSLLTDKQVGGVCGALLTNVSAWLSGIWFDIRLIGGVFESIANALPFVHAVELERAVAMGDYAQVLPHLWWVLGYAAAISALAVFAFLRQMKKQ